MSAIFDSKKKQLIHQFRSAASGNVRFAVACKPDPHLSFSVLMRRLDGKLHHVLGESRYHSFVFLGKGKTIQHGKKVECTKKHHITKRLIAKTPPELLRWLQDTVDDDCQEFECFDLDAWEARRPRYSEAFPAYVPRRPPKGYH